MERGADELLERFGVVWSVVAPVVDEQAGCARHAARVGAVHVLGDAGRVLPLAQVVPEAVLVEADLPRVRAQLREQQRVLVPDQQVVHLPEPSLRRGGLGGLGCELRVRVDVGERQVPPDVAHVVLAVPEQICDRDLRVAAVGALVVAVLEQRHRRVMTAADVVPLGIDGDREVGERLDGD